MNALLPAKETFVELAAAGYNLIPVRGEVPVGAVAVETLFHRLARDGRGFLLEGEAFGEATGGRVVIGFDPLARLSLFGTAAELKVGPRRRRLDGRPLTVLQQTLDVIRCPEQPPEMAVAGALFGYLDYDAAATFERVRGVVLPDDRLLGEWLLCRSLVFYTPGAQQATVVCQVPVTGKQQAATAYAAAARSVRRIAGLLAGGKETPLQGEPVSFALALGETARASYTKNVRAAKEYIKAGEAFQIVLSHPFTCPAGATPPLFRYRQLKKSNPSPYMFYFSSAVRTLLGTSPEMLVKACGGKVYSRPIAGTRRRSADPVADQAAEQSLLADDKERAEHAMLVDLSRNDLGRIAVPGTVAVHDIMRVERFARVMHMVSDVVAEREPEASATAVLAACFPAGTVSGAPKVRAMEIIHELEQDFRGPYAGAFGWLGARGELDLCITIRTAFQENDVLCVRAGAGIVADSDPDKEYDEIQAKAAALFAALEAKQDDFADR